MQEKIHIPKLLADKKKSARTSIAPLGEILITKPTRNAFLQWIYKIKLVETSAFSAHCSDKLIFAQILESVAPEVAEKFHPRTLGLKKALPKIHTLFPRGFVVKPTDDMNSDGKSVYVEESFWEAYEKNPEIFLQTSPKPNALTGEVSSGETFLVQEKIGERAEEYRLHTLEHHVVKGATYTRWNQAWNRESFHRAEVALQEFLDALPRWVLAGQAWGVDLMEGPKGFQIVEVNTNRGREIHWSGDLNIPDTLRAYVLLLEEKYGAVFSGKVGEMLRAGEANREKYLEKFGQEEVELHAALKHEMQR